MLFCHHDIVLVIKGHKYSTINCIETMLDGSWIVDSGIKVKDKIELRCTAVYFVNSQASVYFTFCFVLSAFHGGFVLCEALCRPLAKELQMLACAVHSLSMSDRSYLSCYDLHYLYISHLEMSKNSSMGRSIM